MHAVDYFSLPLELCDNCECRLLNAKCKLDFEIMFLTFAPKRFLKSTSELQLYVEAGKGEGLNYVCMDMIIVGQI